MRLKLNDPILYGKKPRKVSEIVLGSFLLGTVKGFPNDPSDKSPRYKHWVTIIIDDVAESFPYYTSIADHEAGKKKLTDDDLTNAFECIISDAISGMMSYPDFLREFGCDNADPKYTKRIYDACVRARKSLRGIADDDLYKLINAISEKEFVILKE
jgi:hypothetical protein